MQGEPWSGEHRRGIAVCGLLKTTNSAASSKQAHFFRHWRRIACFPCFLIPPQDKFAKQTCPLQKRKCCIFFVNAKQKEVQTRCLCLNTRSVFLTIEAGIPRIAVDNLWNTGRQVRGPTFSVSILLPVKADALFLLPFTLSPPKSPRSNGICIAFLRSAMECGNANMLRFDEYGRMEVAA